MNKHTIKINLSDEKGTVVGGDVTKYICIYDPNNPLEKHNEHTIEFSLDEWSHELLMRTPSVIFSILRWGTDEMIESLKSRCITPVEASIVLRDFGEYLSMMARKLKQDMEKESECSVPEFINRISNISELEKDFGNQNKKIIAFYIASDIVIRMATMIVHENAFQKEDERLYPKYRDVIKAYESVYKLSREEAIYRKRRMWEQYVPQANETFDKCQDTCLFDRVCTEDMKTYEKCLTETTHGVVSAYRNIEVDLQCGYAKYIENEVTQKIIENMIVQYMPLDSDIDIQERSVQAVLNNEKKILTEILTEIKKAVVGTIKNIEVDKENDADENLTHDDDITIRLTTKDVALLLIYYAYAHQKDIKYNNPEEVRQRINELSSSELRQFISDMLKEIEKSGD